MVTRVVNKSSGAVYDVSVTRPSPFSNPYAVDRGKFTRAQFLVGTLSEALRGYEGWLTAHPELIARARKELRGKTLACVCVNDLRGTAPIVCHAQILARVADGKKLPILPALKVLKT
jgi:hypothetical protein